jgi:hypothetical protein
MALTAAELAQFLPTPVDPTAGARAFSGSMQNIEAARANRAQEQQQKKVLRQQQWQFNETQRIAAEKQAAEQESAQYAALADLPQHVRTEDPALLHSAINRLKSTGLDAEWEEGGPPAAEGAAPVAGAPTPAAPADGLGEVRDPDEIANPMKYATEQPAPAAAESGPPAPPEPDAAPTEAAAPQATPAPKGRLVIKRKGKVIAEYPIDMFTEPGKAAMRSLQPMVEQSGVPMSANLSQEDYNAALAAAGGDKLKARELVMEEVKRRAAAAENELDRQAGIQAAQASSGRADGTGDRISYYNGRNAATRDISGSVKARLEAYKELKKKLTMLQANRGDPLVYTETLFGLARAAQGPGPLSNQDVQQFSGFESFVSNLLSEGEKQFSGTISASRMAQVENVLKQQLALWQQGAKSDFDRLLDASSQVNESASQGYRNGLLATYGREFGEVAPGAAGGASAARRRGGGGGGGGKPKATSAAGQKLLQSLGVKP